MTTPNLLLALVISLLYGSVYHFLRGGGGWRFLIYLGASILGFFTGHLFSIWQGWQIFMVGSINLGMGTLGSLVFLVASEWLSRIEVNRESRV
ncbi:MAG: hypothetical protein FJZ87_11210 [Chloroflexi bacterium]|nr:hypothetical protein [Chloroflexota bacterium]